MYQRCMICIMVYDVDASLSLYNILFTLHFIHHIILLYIYLRSRQETGYDSTVSID